jgi:hypothetical protein
MAFGRDVIRAREPAPSPQPCPAPATNLPQEKWEQNWNIGAGDAICG